MDGLLSTHSNRIRALLIGLLAVTVSHWPPFNLSARADRLLYDTWVRLGAPEPPADIVLVRLEDPGWLDTLASLSRHAGARLLVSTWPQPPRVAADEALGPVVVGNAGSGTNVLRATEWRNGGHLWLRNDPDGVVRHDHALVDHAGALPSLALAAALALDSPEPAAGSLQTGQAIRPPPFVDEQGRRWLRFYAPERFPVLVPAQLAITPEVLRDKIVVAGHDDPLHATPVGALSTQELIAQILAGYRDGSGIRTSLLAQIGGWIAVALLLVAVLARDNRGPAYSASLAGAGLAGLVLASGVAFQAFDLWLPVAGPAFLLAAGTAVPVLDARRADESPAPSRLADARRLAAGGHAEEAWALYRPMPPRAALLAELYDLGRALQRQGRDDEAIDVFHRIASVDPHYADVARHLAGGVGDNDASAARPPAVVDGRAPARFGRYELLEPLGRGAMGTVYLGRDPKINRIVAIKAIDLAEEFEPEDVEEAARRFLREAETAGRLDHPGIVTIFDVGEAGGFAYIAMEFLKGKHLSEHTGPARLLPVRTVLELVARVADALDYAHRQNVVHRDIKPANIMYDSASDSLKITDFGIARSIDVSRTRTGIVLGTPSFMSPEQLEGKNVNGHTDLFALGVSLYELLTGRLPFKGSSMTQLMFVIANEPHLPLRSVRPDLPEPLEPLVDTALAKEPADRFASCADMAVALREAAVAIG